MGNYGWGSKFTQIQVETLWGPLGRSYGADWKYCNLDASAWTTVRNGYDNNSAYFAGTYTLENGIQLNADVHYWDTELKNDYYPYFVQHSHTMEEQLCTDDGGIIAYSDGKLLVQDAAGRSMASSHVRLLAVLMYLAKGFSLKNLGELNLKKKLFLTH